MSAKNKAPHHATTASVDHDVGFPAVMLAGLPREARAHIRRVSSRRCDRSDGLHSAGDSGASIVAGQQSQGIDCACATAAGVIVFLMIGYWHPFASGQRVV